MAENHASSGAENPVMDYAEHDRTYSLFLTGAKWLTIACIALLIGMAFGFFAGFGLIGGAIVTIIVAVLGGIIL